MHLWCDVMMTLNFTANKTEAIAHFAGTGSRKARAAIAEDGNTKGINTHNGCNIQLRFVQSYKHLGTNTSVCGDMAEEVTTRACVLGKQAYKLSNIFFNNPKVAVAHKVSICKMFFLTKGCFQCGTWPSLSANILSKFSSAIMKLYRIATNNVYSTVQPGKIINDGQLIYQHNL